MVLRKVSEVLSAKIRLLNLSVLRSNLGDPAQLFILFLRSRVRGTGPPIVVILFCFKEVVFNKLRMIDASDRPMRACGVVERAIKRLQAKAT